MQVINDVVQGDSSTMDDKEIFSRFVDKDFCKSQHDRNTMEHNTINDKLDKLLSYHVDNGKPSIDTRFRLLEEWKNRQDGYIKGTLKVIGPYVFICILWGIYHYINYATITGKTH